MKTKNIKEKLGYVHLDVETHEPQACEGGFNTFLKYKPIISAETSNKNN